jgi:regulator of replication initiation timing
MTKEEMELQLKAISEKFNHLFTDYKDLGDGSVRLIGENAHIRISKKDLEMAYEQFKLKLHERP